MFFSQTWTLSLWVTLLLAFVAALGYLLGRRHLQLRGNRARDGRNEVLRALAVAEELDSIAGRLRAALSAHLPWVAKFQRRISRIERGTGASWHELCDRADELLKPTLRLGTEISHGYAEILRQMAHLSSFAELRADPLTAINNRRAFDESLQMLIAEQARYPAPLSLAMIDVDRFKQVNDQRGHLYGDRMLQELAALLKSNVRECDLLARYGGEEFAILMPRTELHAACNLAERLRSGVAANTPLTVSIGLSEWTENDSANTFVSRADAALYAAKDAGRNCVHLHESASGRIVGIRHAAGKTARDTSTNDKKSQRRTASNPPSTEQTQAGESSSSAELRTEPAAGTGQDCPNVAETVTQNGTVAVSERNSSAASREPVLALNEPQAIASKQCR